MRFSIRKNDGGSGVLTPSIALDCVPALRRSGDGVCQSGNYGRDYRGKLYHVRNCGNNSIIVSGVSRCEIFVSLCEDCGISGVLLRDFYGMSTGLTATVGTHWNASIEVALFLVAVSSARLSIDKNEMCVFRRSFAVKELWTGTSLGLKTGGFTFSVPAMDIAIFRCVHLRERLC